VNYYHKVVWQVLGPNEFTEEENYIRAYVGPIIYISSGKKYQEVRIRDLDVLGWVWNKIFQDKGPRYDNLIKDFGDLFESFMPYESRYKKYKEWEIRKSIILTGIRVGDRDLFVDQFLILLLKYCPSRHICTAGPFIGATSMFHEYPTKEVPVTYSLDIPRENVWELSK